MSNKVEPREIKGLINFPCCDAQLIVYRDYPPKTEIHCPICGKDYLFNTKRMSAAEITEVTEDRTIFNYRDLDTLRWAKKKACAGHDVLIDSHHGQLRPYIQGRTGKKDNE